MTQLHQEWQQYRREGRFTTAEELRQAPERFLRVSPKEIARIITLHTSGSSGRPKRVFFTEEDMMNTVDFYEPGMAPLVQPGERAVVFMEGPGRFTSGGILKMALARFGAETLVHGLIRDYDAAARDGAAGQCFVGLPGQMAALAVTAPHLRPKTVLLSGDYVPQSVIRRLERVWGCEVYNHWGMTETGYGGGVECAQHDGYHLRPGLIVEVVHPETLEPVPEGTYGELVITTLWRKGMPFIRYRTGDLGRLLPGKCACGDPSPRLDFVKGRMENDIPLPDGDVISIHQLDEWMYAIPALKDYRAAICPPGELRIAFDGEIAPEEITAHLRSRWPGLTITAERTELPPLLAKRQLDRKDT